MTGMVTTLNLIANEEGNYAGGSANYSGPGFAKMKFIANALPPEDFDGWVQEVQKDPNALTKDTYTSLSMPDVPAGTSYYGSVTPTLFEDIVQKFTSAAVD